MTEQIFHISQAGLDLLKQFEGLSLTAYKCPAGVWTIGYGTTKGVKPGMKITKQKAEQLLKEDLHEYETGVLEAIGEGKEWLLQPEFDAMVCLCYNIGVGNFKRSSVARFYKRGDKTAAANAFGMWIKASGRVLRGLVARRAAEKVLFLSGERFNAVRPSKSGVATVPQTSVVPDATGQDKPLHKSKEILGGTAVSLGGVANVVNTLTLDDASNLKTSLIQTRSDVEQSWLAKYHVPEIFSVLIVAVGILVIYKRFINRKHGIR